MDGETQISAHVKGQMGINNWRRFAHGEVGL